MNDKMTFDEAELRYQEWAKQRGETLMYLPEQRCGSWFFRRFSLELLAVVHSTGEVVRGDEYLDGQRQLAFARLKEKGVARAEVEFSGGYDEGGVDSISLYDSEGIVVEKLNVEDGFGEVLSIPIYEKYWSFAGEPSVTGVVSWDVANETITISGDERSYFEEEWE